MTKADIVNRVATATGVTKFETEILIEGFFKTIADALASGEHIEIRGFGTFKTKKRKPRMARNPRTGAQVPLDEHFVPTFKPSRELRSLIDDRQKSLESLAKLDMPVSDGVLTVGGELLGPSNGLVAAGEIAPAV